MPGEYTETKWKEHFLYPVFESIPLIISCAEKEKKGYFSTSISFLNAQIQTDFEVTVDLQRKMGLV